MAAVIAMTVVAFYGPKPAALSALFDAAQRALGAALGTAFQPRPVDDVHATLIGLEARMRGRRRGVHRRRSTKNAARAAVRPVRRGGGGPA
jgi:hypothetical protein